MGSGVGSFTGGAPAPPRDRNASAFAASLDDFWSTPSLSSRRTGAKEAVPESAPVPAQVHAPQASAQRPKTLEEVETTSRGQYESLAPGAAQQPPRALTLEEVEAQMRAKAGAKPPAAAPAGASAMPSQPPPPPQAARMPPPSMPPPGIAEPNPQAAHMARLRAMLEACPSRVQQTILSLPPPIQFESLENVVSHFPSLLQRDTRHDYEDAAVRELTSEAGPRMHAWETAEERRRNKALKLQHITKYNGVMSGSDKDFITRIQISQLVSPDPYVDDFYAHVFFAVRGGGRRIALPDTSAIQSQRDGANERGGKANARRKLSKHENAMLRMQQQVERLVETRKKRLTQSSSLEGALGRVSLGTVRKPRQMLQLINERDAPQAKHDAASAGEQKDAVRIALEGASFGSKVDAALASGEGTHKREPLTRRESLMALERLYDTVLALEQLRRQGPNEDGGEDPLEKQLTDRLWDELRVLEPLDVSTPHPFISLMNHVKGKRLLPRAMRLISAEQSLTILTMLIASFETLDAVQDYAAWERSRVQSPGRQSGTALTKSQAMDIERNIDACMNSAVTYMISLIASAPLRIVSGMLALLMDRNDVLLVAKTRPGVSIFTVLLSRAESLRQASETPADEIEQWNNVFGVLLDRLSLNGQLPQLFPSTRMKSYMPFGLDLYGGSAMQPASFNEDAEDEPVWNLMALFAILADLSQQQILVQELREKILANVLAANEAARLGESGVAGEDARIRNVNLLLHALNLDAAQITL